MRFISLAEQLCGDNTVFVTGFEPSIAISDKIERISNADEFSHQADCLILPIPASNDGVTLNAPYSSEPVTLKSLSSLVKDNGFVFGGRLSEDICKIFCQRGIKVYDYLMREELAVLNALATAEGALQIALEEQPVLLSGEKILVVGMGRIAKSLIRLLDGFGTHITAAARKYSDLAWAEVLGCSSIMISELDNSNVLCNADLIFNTVPCRLLNKSLLKQCRKDCLLIDLASKPGGIDIEAAGKLGLRAIWALSLPGKTAPESSGIIIANTILNILSEHKLK